MTNIFVILQALEYLQQLRESNDGWQMCGATLSTGGSQLDEKVKFVCLQVGSRSGSDIFWPLEMVRCLVKLGESYPDLVVEWLLV